jgi:hypothetical protein
VEGRLFYRKTGVVKNEQTAERVCTVATKRVCTVATKTTVTVNVQQLELSARSDTQTETNSLNIKHNLANIFVWVLCVCMGFVMCVFVWVL